MRATVCKRRSLGALAVALGVLVPGAAGVRADDADLFTNTVPPNVLLFIDTSASMNGIMYHKAWDGTDPSGCQVIPTWWSGTGTLYDDDSHGVTARCAGSGCRLEVNEDTWGFVSTPGVLGSSKSGYVERTFCGQTRKLYHDGNVQDRGNDDDASWWYDPYIDWYFSLDPSDTTTTYGPDNQTAAEILAEVDNNTTGTYYIGGGSFPLYKRSRITAATEVAKEVMYRINSECAAYAPDCGVYQNNIRFGTAQFQVDAHGGYVSADIGDYTGAGGNKATLEADLADMDTMPSTPLSETLFKLYTYFMSRTDSERPLGDDGVTRFPKYDYRLSNGDGDAPSDDLTTDPVDHWCRQNFIIVLTDGEPTSDDFSTSGNDTDGFADFDDLIGDYAPDDAGDPDIGTDSTPEEGSPPWISSAGTGYLDDIALFMQENDLRPVEYPDTMQTVDVYTIGFGTTGDAVHSMLQKTADNGNGLFRKASQSDELVQAMIEALADVIEKTQSFTAATVPASRATDGNNFFTSYFTPSSQSPFWEGHLKLFEFNAKGEVRDKPAAVGLEGECALDDPDAPTSCRKGALKLTLDGYWDAADEIPAPGSRNLYVSNYYSAGPPAASLIPVVPPVFDVPPTKNITSTGGSLTPTDLGVNGAGASDIATYDLSLPEFDITGITTDVDLAAAIVGYVRGCEFRSGACVDRGDGNKLWDIFHSNPVVVGPPNAALRERTYREFVGMYKHRKRVIYAGSNGGFVHGFNAGEYDTALMPGTYDRGTGEEEFGFMAYPARQNIAGLPKDRPPRDFYYMDGSPTAADVWLPPDGTPLATPATTTWERWRTVLLGGMREGGNVVWALDVTNPPDHNSPNGEVSPGGPPYPGYLWEFPCEASSCDTWREYMGETWSQPVVTRVKATYNCGNSTDSLTWAACPRYDRWVAIFGAGYDESGDPNRTWGDPTGTIAAGEYDPGTDSDTLRAGRALFMIDIATGQVLAAKRFDPSGTAGDPSDGEPRMQYAIASTPAVFDLDFDGYADVVYVGDLGGNVWKWVIDQPAEDHIRGLSGNNHQARWEFLKILTAENCTTCSPKHYKSFFYPPTGAVVGQHLWLALGSGERDNLEYGQDGVSDDKEKNRFYVFKDVDPYELDRTAPDPTDASPDDAVLTDAASSTDFISGTSITDSNRYTCLGTAAGYYYEGEAGEKFITESVIFFGVVLSGSYLPAPSTADPCSASGAAYLYGFRLFCGEGVMPPENEGDPKECRIQVGDSGGLPNAPRVSVGPGDGGGGGGGGGGSNPCEEYGDVVLVLTSENSGFEDCVTERPDSGLRVKSWRDL